MIFDSFFKAIGQIGDPRFNRVLLMGVGLSLALLVAATTGFAWFVDWLLPETISIPFLGEVTWLSTVLGWGSLLMMFALSMFLMVPVASAFTSMFLDQVAQAVEDRHYPHLPAAPCTALSDGLRDTLNFLGVLIAANLLALILYLFFIPLAPFIFWALNGFLLGREYFVLAAMRRVGRQQAYALRKTHAVTIWVAGVLMAIPLSIPLVNLLVPILGAATFTHIFHAVQSGSRSS